MSDLSLTKARAEMNIAAGYTAIADDAEMRGRKVEHAFARREAIKHLNLAAREMGFDLHPLSDFVEADEPEAA